MTAKFWGTLLGEAPRDVGRPGWFRIGPLEGGGPAITFQPVGELKTVKNRVHLDIQVDDLEAAADLVGQLGGSGPMSRTDYREGTVAVMADPEGNEFCVVALVPGSALA